MFVNNTCVSLDIAKTSPQDHDTLSAFHAFAGPICIPCLLHHSTYVVIFRSERTLEQASC
jgi:hypothetical protein